MTKPKPDTIDLIYKGTKFKVLADPMLLPVAYEEAASAKPQNLPKMARAVLGDDQYQQWEALGATIGDLEPLLLDYQRQVAGQTKPDPGESPASSD